MQTGISFQFEHPWKPVASLPELRGKVKSIALDTETTPERDIRQRLPVGLSVCTPDEKTFYLPWAHKGGGNLDEATIRRWAKNELVDLDIFGLNAGYEVRMFKNWGVSLEQQGCQLHNIPHWAALLDDFRRRFSLEVLSADILDEHKIELPFPPTEIHLRHAGEVAPYAERDALLTWRLRGALWPLIEKEGLERVATLEDDLIFPVTEMEENLVLLDQEKLLRWDKEVAEAAQDRIMSIYRQTGLKVRPRSHPDMLGLFKHLNLKATHETSSGMPTIDEAHLIEMNHPIVTLALEASQLDSLRSKYLKKYLKVLFPDNHLPFSLHQLRGDQYGARSGRFSSANVNIQQAKHPKKQEPVTRKWIIRELFLPAPGKTWLRADGNQIEFRIFVHYSESKRLIDAFHKPGTDFHVLVAKLTRLERDIAKNVNYARLFGAGFKKIASMLPHLDKEEVHEVLEKYDAELPEVRRLTNYCSQMAERRGYIKTMLGRRRRFSREESKYYMALNAAIQGTAADIMKLKLIEVYRERKSLGLTMRFPVHDELNADLDDPGQAPRVKELLDTPCMPLSVPVPWDVGLGKTWREAV